MIHILVWTKAWSAGKSFALKKKHIKLFFKSGINEPFSCLLGQKCFEKFISPKSFVLWDLWRILTFKIDLHPPGTSKPSKTAFLLQQNCFFDGFVNANQF